METMMATMAKTRAADTEKVIKETTEKEKKEKRAELDRKQKEKEEEEREELFWKEEKESREEFHRILSSVRNCAMEFAKGYESPMKDVESDGTGRDVTGESQGNTGPVRRKFRKFGLKKMTTTTGEEEEIPSPPGMFNINDEFTTSTTMEEDNYENNGKGVEAEAEAEAETEIATNN